MIANILEVLGCIALVLFIGYQFIQFKKEIDSLPDD